MIPSRFIPITPTSEALQHAVGVIRRLETAFDEGKPDAALIVELKALTGNDHLVETDYFSVSSASTYEDAAYIAFSPNAVAVPDLTFEQFLWICETLLAKIGTDATGDYWFLLYCANAKRPDAGDLIFHAPQEWIDRLKASGEIRHKVTWNDFTPTAQQLAVEAWKSETILL